MLASRCLFPEPIMLYLDALPIASLCMPAPLAVTQETCRGSDVSALNFTVHGSSFYGGTPVVNLSDCHLLFSKSAIEMICPSIINRH